MIRIDLQPRSTRFRWIGIVAGLCVGFGAFAGALYTLDQRMPLGGLWNRLTAGESRPESRPEPASAPAAVMTAAGPPSPSMVPPQVTDAVRGVAQLARHLPPGFALHALAADSSGSFVFEGMLAGTDPLALAALLHSYATDIRVTRWSSSGGMAGASRSCRVVGKVAASTVEEAPIVQAHEVGSLFDQAEAMARASGLRGVGMVIHRVDAQGSAYVRHRVDLTGRGEPAQLERLLQSLHKLPVRVTRLAVASPVAPAPAPASAPGHGPRAEQTGDVVVSLDALVDVLVRVSPGGGI